MLTAEPTIADVATTQPIPLSRIDGVTADLAAVLAMNGAPAPATTPIVEATSPLSEAELTTLDLIYTLSGNLLALGNELSAADGLPIGPIVGHVAEPLMLIEITQGTDQERKDEVDRIARLLRTTASADYLDTDLRATYSAERAFGCVMYRVLTQLAEPPIAAAVRQDLLGTEVVVAELVEEDAPTHDDVIEAELVGAELALPGAQPRMARSGYVVQCTPCELFGEPLPDAGQAGQLAATHDDLHHRGAPTAHIRITPIPVASAPATPELVGADL